MKNYQKLAITVICVMFFGMFTFMMYRNITEHTPLSIFGPAFQTCFAVSIGLVYVYVLPLLFWYLNGTKKEFLGGWVASRNAYAFGFVLICLSWITIELNKQNLLESAPYLMPGFMIAFALVNITKFFTHKTLHNRCFIEYIGK